MKLSDLEHKRILIAGYGREGRATEQFLKSRVPSAELAVTDISYGRDYLADQNRYDFVIRTPSIPVPSITARHTTATNIFFANVPNIKIGVTGTKGKSTTSTLIYHILSTAGRAVHLVGNIGNPMLEEIMKPYGEDDIFVCELSSYQLEDIGYTPQISVILNLYPEHMDHHGSVESYYAAKRTLLAYADRDSVFIYNPSFLTLTRWAAEFPGITKPFAPDLPFDTAGIPLLGKHNLDNIRAAYTAAKQFGIDDEVIEKAVKTFTPLRHRLQNVGEYRGITFFDDAISTTPQSTIEAIESVGTVGVIMLGGLDRGYDFSELAAVLATHKIPHIVLFPHSGAAIRREIMNRGGYQPSFFETSDMKEAVEYAYKHASAGTVCLLSTASPSYSIWKNFEEKGDLFQKYVTELGKPV